MIEAAARDLRFAARALRRTPGFTAAAVLTLAIGIGATTAVFSVVYGVLLRPLPFPTADRLVQIVQLLRGSRVGLTPEQITEWRATSRSFAEIGYYSHTSLSLTDVPVPMRLNGTTISVPLFRAVGVQPLMGRLFTEEEEAAGNERVVVLSHALWASRFASGDLLGRPITLGGRPYRVLGIMPRGFGFPSLATPGMSMNADGELSDAPEFWIPMVRQARPAGPATGGMTLVTTFALLRQGVTLEQAAAEANTLMPARVGERYSIELVSARVEQTRPVRRVLLIFQAAVLVVLFIACANVTNLMLARAAGRRRELAVRLALGASRTQVARYAISESVIVGVFGGVAGCLLAYQAVALVRSLPPYVLPRLAEIHVDAVVLAMAAAAAVGAGVLVGAWTAVRMLRGNFADTAWQARSSAGPHQPSRLLVIAETAAGVVLLAGAALLLGSFVRLAAVDRGFAASDVYSFRVSLPARLAAPPAQHAFHRELDAALRGLPGVRSVGAVEGTLGGMAIGSPLTVNGETLKQAVGYQRMTPGVFETLRIPLRGRDFSPADRAENVTTAIVNESFARKFFAGRDPVGQRFVFQDWASVVVVGVAGDVRPRDPAAAIRAEFYLPTTTTRGFGAPTYLVRSDGRPRDMLASIRAAAARIDHDAVVFDATPLDALLARQVTTPKFFGMTATGFAAVAVALAALGLYGVLSYSVGARTREFGIRIAIGATPRRVIEGVMRQAIGTVIVGVAIGLAGAFWSSRLLEAQLFGVQPQDPATLAGVAIVFIAVALLAAYVPARRATRVDPIAALRAE